MFLSSNCKSFGRTSLKLLEPIRCAFFIFEENLLRTKDRASTLLYFFKHNMRTHLLMWRPPSIFLSYQTNILNESHLVCLTFELTLSQGNKRSRMFNSCLLRIGFSHDYRRYISVRTPRPGPRIMKDLRLKSKV